MRFGVWGVFTFLLLVFLYIVNLGVISNDEVDEIFVGLDVNSLDSIDQNISDANFGSFVKYTVKGFSNEVHGGYYFAAWLNSFLPEWVLANLDLLILLFFLGLVAPVLFYGFLLAVAVVMMSREWLVERKKRRIE